MKKDYSRGYSPYTKPTDPPKGMSKAEWEKHVHTTDSIMKADYPEAVKQMENLKMVDGKVTGDSDLILPATKAATKKAREIINKKKEKK